ncbi:MAG: hypothetical protein HY730_03760 [Candidatus Tectomicrobia bacterium]|uniref:Uncharacterized protein n=1 Tax=Tectimicrobiota bacterium TaxID=2528274 RepID=A0A933GKE6_UNCTE|nr:hypothetical protein [Candidatus Tectomicrobia bacterium]
MNELYYRRGWTDGLPIVPPTLKRVEKMLDYTDYGASDLITTIPPKYGEATIEKMAINAVMAGCIPPYMPLIIAAVQAMSEQQFNLYGVQATTHLCAPLLIVNGPMARELNINCSYNVFGQGWRSNSTIGRAIRLILMNIGGGIPGILDRATLGQPGKYSYCIAENEEQNPWEPLHVEKGFKRDESTVTVVGAEGPHNINDHISTNGSNILSIVAGTMAPLGSNNTYAFGEPLLVLGPEHAAIIARDGFTKKDIKKFLYEQARNPMHKLKLGGMYGMGSWPKWIHTEDDSVMVPVVQNPEDFMVIVAGGPGRHSVCIPTFGITRSVTKPVALKDGTIAKSINDFKRN